MISTVERHYLEHFWFFYDILEAVLGGRVLPMLVIKMLSSRFSGKTHVVEDVFVKFLVQQKKNVVLHYVRSRAKDSRDAFRTFTEQLNAIVGESNYYKNETDRLIRFGNNKIYFSVLNEEKMKVKDGKGKLGLPIEYNADYIFCFFEECSQLSEELVLQYKEGLRGNQNTQICEIYASNP